jgi:hypothetical protein
LPKEGNRDGGSKDGFVFKNTRLSLPLSLKKRILDDFCDTYGYHRKAAVRLFRQAPISDKKPKRPGKKKIYELSLLLEPPKKIGLATEQMCGKRLNVIGVQH